VDNRLALANSTDIPLETLCPSQIRPLSPLLWEGILLFTPDHKTFLSLLLTSKILHQATQNVLNLIMDDARKEKLKFNRMTIRAKCPQTFFTTTFTAITTLNGNLIGAGNNNDFFQLYLGENTLFKEIKARSTGNIIAINKLAASWLTLSDQGMIQIFKLNKNMQLTQVCALQLDIKNLKKEWAIALENGKIATFAVTSSGYFEIYFISANENNEISFTKTPCDQIHAEKFYQIDKIHLVGNSIYVVPCQKTKCNRPGQTPTLFIISEDGQFQNAKVTYTDDIDYPCYGVSQAASFTQITSHFSENPVYLGIDITSESIMDQFDKEVREYHANLIHHNIDDEESEDGPSCVKDKTLGEQFRQAQFIEFLPNNHLFVKEKEKLLIYHFELKNFKSNTMINPDSFRLIHTEFLHKTSQKNLTIRSVTATKKGDVLIHTDDSVYQWNLRGQELVAEKSAHFSKSKHATFASTRKN
jgi:hypothetical protein